MTKAVMIAKVVFILTFATLWIYLFINQKYVSMAVFFAIFLIGWFIQRKQVFWKISLVFYGLMSVVFSFGVFGGLEPNTPGVISTGDWLSLEFLLYLMLVLAAIMSLVGGQATEKMERIN